MSKVEYDRLQILADRWDVPLATAAYGLFADQLSKIARRAPTAMPKDLLEAASRVLLGVPKGDDDGTDQPQGGEPLPQDEVTARLEPDEARGISRGNDLHGTEGGEG